MKLAKRLLLFVIKVVRSQCCEKRQETFVIAGYLIPEKVAVCDEARYILVDEAVMLNCASRFVSSEEKECKKKGEKLMEVLESGEPNWSECPYVKRYRMSVRDVKHLFSKVENLPFQSFLVE